MFSKCVCVGRKCERVWEIREEEGKVSSVLFRQAARAFSRKAGASQCAGSAQ